MSESKQFNWGSADNDATTASAQQSMNRGADDDEKLPQDSDHLDPETGIRTIVKYYRNEQGIVIKLTRRLLQKKKQVTVHKAVHHRRTLPKFGDLTGVPPGLEANVSYSDNAITLTLTGEKEEEKSDVDQILNKIRGKKGFLFDQSARVREKAMDSKEVEDLPVVATSEGKFVPKAISEKRAQKGKDEDLPTVRVGNLAEEATQDDVRELFRKFGMVTRVHVARNRDTNQSKGYGFVTFANKSDAERAIQKLNGHGYANLILQVEWAKSMAEWKSSRPT